MPVLRDRQRRKLIQLLSAIQIHDALPQFFALILADDITAQRAEFDSYWITTAERLINLLKCSFAYSFGLRFAGDASLARGVGRRSIVFIEG